MFVTTLVSNRFSIFAESCQHISSGSSGTYGSDSSSLASWRQSTPPTVVATGGSGGTIAEPQAIIVSAAGPAITWRPGSTHAAEVHGDVAEIRGAVATAADALCREGSAAAPSFQPPASHPAARQLQGKRCGGRGTRHVSGATSPRWRRRTDYCKATILRHLWHCRAFNRAFNSGCNTAVCRSVHSLPARDASWQQCGCGWLHSRAGCGPEATPRLAPQRGVDAVSSAAARERCAVRPAVAAAAHRHSDGSGCRRQALPWRLKGSRSQTDDVIFWSTSRGPAQLSDTMPQHPMCC